MAEVFEAELAGDLGFVRKVAIKRMLERAAADPLAARRFLDEAAIASRLHHANVISVVDLGLLDDRPFQVLEYVDGLDGHQLLQRAGGKLPLDVALAISNAIAHALDHAHSAVDESGLPLGIVHRDVKPSNVLVSWSGDVKLGDFGIAVVRDRVATTDAGLVSGTVGFIAPEQRARGTLDGRTDVFSLGLTLHAFATGASPFADIEVEVQALAGTPVPIDATLPADVREVLAAALQLERTARPTSAELATQLGAMLAPRLRGDSRSMLRDFMATLDPTPAPRAGALDGLLGIEVIKTAAGPDELPRFETRAAQPTTLERRRPKESPGDATTHDVAVHHRTRRGVLAAVLLGVCVIGVLAIWQLRGGGTSDVVTVDSHDLVALADASIAPADSALELTPIADAHDEPPRVVTDAPLARDAASRPRRDASVVDAATGPVGNGYVQVLGESLIGASVLIDGRVVGSVPTAFEVSYGAHRVEVEAKDGTRLPAITVEVKEIHNRANPLRPRW